nr:copia protein [Tanacetum cinerariifolium]
MKKGDANTTNPPTNPPTHQAPHTLSTFKLPILKNGEYDIWAVKMEHYLEHTGVSSEDANQKFLRSLSSSWSQVSLIMRTKPGVDTLNFDDLYNNLKVFESNVKGSTGSSSSTQNVAFVSSDNTRCTNEVNTAYSGSTSSGHNSQKEGSSSYTNYLMYSFFANQSSGPLLDHEDLEQDDEFDPEEMDLKWQVAMISTRLKKSNGNQDRRKRDAGNTRYKTRDNGKRPAKQDKHKAMVTIDREGVDWTGHAKDKTEDYALMAFNSNNSGSNTKVTSCSKVCKESYAKLKKLYDEQREQLGVASIEIQAYTLAIKNFPSYEPKSDFGIDESNSTYGPKQSTTSASDTKTSDLDSCDSSSSKETLESMPKPVESKHKVVNTHKFWFDDPIIEEYESDSDDEYVSKASVEQEKPSRAFINTFKHTLKGKGIVDSGCSRHMTGNWSYLVDYQDFNGGPVAFGGSKGQITGKGKIRTGKLAFEDVYFVKELQHYNLFSVSQMCDKKNKVLFTDTECLVLSPDFMLFDENQVLLRVPRQHNMYSFNLENIVPSGGLAHLIAKATVNESTKWHMMLGIKREYSNDRTLQQNGVVDRNNRTLIEAARTMLADSFLPNTFWAEVVSTACYVLNTVLVTKPQNKTPYELLTGKFEEKSDEGFLVGYSLSSKAFRVYNLETKRVKENLHINFLENKPNVVGKEPTWLFDLDYLIDSMNYQPIIAENKTNHTVVWSSYTLTVKSTTSKNGDEMLNGDIDLKTNEEDKKEEKGIVFRIKARLVAQGHRQEEGIYYDEVFAPVARIKAIGIFLAYASYMGFIVYQMDVKSSFLCEKIDKEVYVSQPLGFMDPKFPNKVYKVVKALYGLHQTPKAWYATLSTFLVKSRYRRGLIDKTLFIKKDKKDIMLMSSMGELTFFLRLQVKQKENGIFISQDKYVAEILKKFDFLSVKTASTPIETKKPLVKDEEAADVDVHLYRSMISSLMYLTASKPDIMRLISWQCKKQTIVSTLTTEAEYVAVEMSLDGTVLIVVNIASIHLLLLGYNLKKYGWNSSHVSGMKFWTSAKVKTVNDEVKIQALVEGKRENIKESSIGRTLRLDDAEAKQTLPLPSNDSLPSGEDNLKLKELMDLCTNLSNKVLELESEVIDIASTYQERIEKLEGRVARLEEENRVLKELKSAHSIDVAAEPVTEKEKSSKQGRKIADIDADVEINLEKAQAEAYNLDLDHKKVTTAGATKRKPLTQAQSKRNMIVYLKNMAGFKMNYFKGMTYDEIRPLFEKHYNNNQTFLDEVNEGVKVLEIKVRQEKVNKVESSKREEEESEMSLELLRLAGRQLNEGKGYALSSYAFCKPIKIFELNKQLSKEKSTVSSLLEEKKRLKSGKQIMDFEQRSSKLGLQSMTSGQISSGLDLTYAPSTITMQQPSEGELDLLFEAMYDDYISGQPSATAKTISPTQEHQVRQTSTASTTIADTAPIPTNSSSLATNILISPQDVDELNPNAMVDGNTFFNPFANSSTSAAASSSHQNVDPSNMRTFYQPYPHEFQWTKDHPLKQVIGEPSRPVLIRNQLRSDGDMCMYALSVSTMEPKNVKEAMTDPAWIDSIQEELLQFKRLDVWVLVPALDNISPLTLKWLFKNC